MATRPVVLVCDTNILCAEPQPYLIGELSAYGTACCLVPASVIAELDFLVQRPEMRQKARAALNVLKGFVERGAAKGEVSAGAAGALRVGQAKEEVCDQGSTKPMQTTESLRPLCKRKPQAPEPS